HRAAIPRRSRGDVNFPAALRQERQRAGRQEFAVVRVGHQAEGDLSGGDGHGGVVSGSLRKDTRILTHCGWGCEGWEGIAKATRAGHVWPALVACWSAEGGT